MLHVVLLALAMGGQGGKHPAAPAAGFTLPAGFTITEVAGPELANDIYCLTISPQGEIVVSGRGFLKQLIDDNNDGILDRAVLIADHPRDGAMGLCFADSYLYFMGDGGFRRLPWKSATWAASSELLLPLRTGGEHDAHAITKGPDGWFYLLCGNTSKIMPEQTALPGKPVKKYIAGGVLRVAPDSKSSEMICDGLRNAYGFDWSTQGELFTYDSDNERCLGLPWYEGCRFLRIEKDGHYGWRSPQLGQFWRLPPYYPDVVAPVLDLGRGSPTGVVCYRHQQFPESYRGDFYLLDWTFGVIHRVSLNKNKAEASVFLKVAPGHGFAPTSACVHPLTGDLYVTTGGRGTRGAIYRIRHDAGFQSLPANATITPITDMAASRTLHRRIKNSTFNTPTNLDIFCNMLRQAGEFHASSPDFAFKEGYELTPNKKGVEAISQRKSILEAARAWYPSPDANLNRELVRGFALMREDEPATVTKLLKQITRLSSPIDDTHILFALACCPAKRTQEQRSTIADALVLLEYKYQSKQLTRERHWELRLSEAVRAHLDLDPDLATALLHHADFSLPQHLNYLSDKRLLRPEMTIHYKKRTLINPDVEWSSKLIEVISNHADDAVLKLLRQKWDDPALRESILPGLAKHPSELDRSLYCTALRQQSRDAVKWSLQALGSLPMPQGDTLQQELVALLQAMKTWNANAPELIPSLRARFVKLSDANETSTATTIPQLEKWLVMKYPACKTLLIGSDSIDLETWKQQHRDIPWTTAKLPEGEKLFKKLCAACHQGNGALGPDLSGIGKRFSRDDLLISILQPSKDVSARYRSSIFVTEDGHTHAGLVIYEAVDGIIVQTGASTSIRLPGKSLAGRRTSEQSLMPAGLLDQLSPQQIADLMGWLQR